MGSKTGRKRCFYQYKKGVGCKNWGNLAHELGVKTLDGQGGGKTSAPGEAPLGSRTQAERVITERGETKEKNSGGSLHSSFTL